MLTGGKAYAGKASVPGGTIVWQDLTNLTATATDPANGSVAAGTAFPGNACGISIEAQGNDAFVKIVRTNGEVWQTHGDIQGQTFVWDEGWFQQATPTPAALRAGKFKRALPPGTARNLVPGLNRP
ncbi:hypothetical protein [Streptomyces sp. NPDC017868]|uniref:hypothetical protein n=1 Tax=Streptomyces sp. NPDC017868 TaxID=3365014 RepID=UPI0037AF5B1C